MTHFSPSLEETRAITIHVSDKVYAGLIERGRAAGYTPTLYAKLLFEAAYAARVGKGDADLVLRQCLDVSHDGARRPLPVAPRAVERVIDPVAVPMIVPVIVPVAIPVAVRDEEAAEPLGIHISSSQPISEEAAGHLATLIGAAVAKFGDAEPVQSPSRARLALNRTIRALAAAGNDVNEIVEELGCSASEVVEALGSDA